jgi:hypothetical protein
VAAKVRARGPRHQPLGRHTGEVSPQDKVEPRREFIQKHALEVKDIDYHGA